MTTTTTSQEEYLQELRESFMDVYRKEHAQERFDRAEDRRPYRCPIFLPTLAERECELKIAQSWQYLWSIREAASDRKMRLRLDAASAAYTQAAKQYLSDTSDDHMYRRAVQAVPTTSSVPFWRTMMNRLM